MDRGSLRLEEEPTPEKDAVKEWARLHQRGTQLMGSLAAALASGGRDGSTTTAFSATNALRKLLPLFQKLLEALQQAKDEELTAWRDQGVRSEGSACELLSQYCAEYDFKVHAVEQMSPGMPEELLTALTIAWQAKPFIVVEV
eukprot:TRINITY_DN1437_c0_g1_i1.p1 TRINITY_DN1437_c0_g1~~TRINITY_DN1437_c0_g1_i1.p1  ORF type:complete len:143 (-),score=37.16 TRINITY_DN1437_c0_g1_i1:197-625(-)